MSGGLSPRRRGRAGGEDAWTTAVRSAGMGFGVSIVAVACVMVPSVWGDASVWARSGGGDACERVEERADRCAYVRASCGDLARGVDYLAGVYCDAEGREALALFGLCLWLVLLLSLLGTTAEVFFIDQLDFMSRRLRLSDDVAGATLMALGNGAPDVFTAWNAIQNAADFPLVLAELLGASIFITTVVLGVVILAAHGAHHRRARRSSAASPPRAKEPLLLVDAASGDVAGAAPPPPGGDLVAEDAPCQIDGKPFARDTAVLGLSIFAISCCALDRSIDLTESVALLTLYALYVASICYAQDGPDRRKLAGGSDDERENAGSPSSVELAPVAADGRPPAAPAAADHPSGGGGALRLRGVHWGDAASAWDRVVHVAELPFSVLRHASIPPATVDGWGEPKRRLAAASVAGAALVVTLDFGLGGDVRALFANPADGGGPPVYRAAALGGGLAAATYAATSRTQPPGMGLRTALVAVGFLATVAWLDLLASETVAVLESLGAAAGLSSAVLGVTALAWGNCIGDLVSDGAVARNGNPKMAVASVFNSPLFSQINALGVPVAYYCFSHGPLRINLEPQAVLSFVVVALSILATSLVARKHDCALPKHHALTLFAIYAAYVTASILIELDRQT